MGDGLGCGDRNLMVCVWNHSRTHPWRKGNASRGHSWRDELRRSVPVWKERSNKNQWSTLCRVCAPSVVTHSILDWVDKIQSKAIAFSSSNRPRWAPVPFACDPGRDIIRRRDGIRGQGRWTLGKAKATVELGEVGKGWLRFIATASIKPFHFCLLPGALLSNSNGERKISLCSFCSIVRNASFVLKAGLPRDKCPYICKVSSVFIFYFP